MEKAYVPSSSVCADEIAGRARNDELMARNDELMARNDELMARNDESLTYMVKNSGRA